MADGSEEVEAVVPLAGVIRGEATIRERIMPRPGSQVIVNLEDTSLADARSTVLASDTIEVSGAPPWRFLLNFDPGEIEERRSYSIRARLVDADGNLQFTSTESIPAFDRNRQGPLEVVMSRVARDDP